MRDGIGDEYERERESEDICEWKRRLPMSELSLREVDRCVSSQSMRANAMLAASANVGRQPRGSLGGRACSGDIGEEFERERLSECEVVDVMRERFQCAKMEGWYRRGI